MAAGGVVTGLPQRGKRRCCRFGKSGRSFSTRCGGLRRWPMPDWQKVVREQLAGLNLGREEEDEVIAELAGHLEETYEALRRDGLPEREAVHQRSLKSQNEAN